MALVGALLAVPGRAESVLTLKEAYRSAVATNEAVRTAEKGVLQADNQLLTTWTQLAPSASIDASGNAGAGPVAAPPPFYSAGTLIQPLFRRSLFPSRDAAHRQVEAAQATLARAREQLMMDVTTAFVAVQRARQQREVARSAVERGKAEVSAAAAKVQAGGALRTVQLQANINARRAELDLAAAEQALRQSENAFERLVGIPPGPSLALPATPQIPSGAKAMELAERRSDVVALQRLALAARAQESVTSGRLWPSLDGAFQYFWFYSLGTPRKPPTDPEYQPPGFRQAYQAQVALTFPLFDSQTLVEMQARRLEAEVAELSVSALRKQIAEEVRLALIDLEAAKKNAELAALQRKEAQENYNLVSTQFKLRVVSFIEVASAQASLTEAENIGVIAEYDRELASYRLLFACGQLDLD